MDETIEPQNDIAKQATHDRSVIDHLVKSFSALDEERDAHDPVREQSAALYHQIRRTWSRAR